MITALEVSKNLPMKVTWPGCPQPQLAKIPINFTEVDKGTGHAWLLRGTFDGIEPVMKVNIFDQSMNFEKVESV